MRRQHRAGARILLQLVVVTLCWWLLRDATGRAPATALTGSVGFVAIVASVITGLFLNLWLKLQDLSDTEGLSLREVDRLRGIVRQKSAAIRSAIVFMLTSSLYVGAVTVSAAAGSPFSDRLLEVAGVLIGTLAVMALEVLTQIRELEDFRWTVRRRVLERQARARSIEDIGDADLSSITEDPDLKPHIYDISH